MTAVPKMAEIDTSIYKQQPIKGPLEVMGEVQNLQRGKLGLDKQKLDLINQNYDGMIRELSAIDPNSGPDVIRQAIQNQVKLGRLTPEIAATTIATIPVNPAEIPNWLKTNIRKAMSTQEIVNAHWGTNSYLNDGQNTTPIRTPSMGGGPIATGAPIANQPPPTTPVIGANNTPQLLGSQQPQIPPGAMPAPGSGIPGQYVPQPQSRLPTTPLDQPKGVPTVRITKPVAAPSNKLTIPAQDITTADLYKGTPNERVAQGFTDNTFTPRGPVTGQTPMFEEGKRMLAADQELATQKLTQIKPAIQALSMMDGLRSGPSTGPWTTAIATLKANGFIPIDINEKDPTVIYQVVNKKLAAYVRQNGTRSDADQALAEESSPSVKVQINPALIKLTRDTIVQDRIQAMRAGAFEGQDYSKVGEHRASFPNKIDERALGVDFMTADERRKLGEEMEKKAGTAEAKKFWDSLKLAKKLNMLGPIKE